MIHQTIVTLTGTGVPHPSPGRAGAGTLVRYGDISLQFDAGRGTVIRLAEAGIEPRDLTAQFITHVHSDHLIDLPDVAMTRWVQNLVNPCGPLTVVSPEGTSAKFARNMFDVFADDIETRQHHEMSSGTIEAAGPEINLVTFAATQEPIRVWASDDQTVVVDSVAVHHEPVTDAVAYRITTPSAVVVISGDTTVCEEVEHLSNGADLLVHEACRSTALGNLVAGTVLEAIFSYHADTVGIGSMAERAGVKHVLLTHLIPPPSSEVESLAFEADVRAGGFNGLVTVGNDLTTMSFGPGLSKNEPIDPKAKYETKLDPARLTHVGIWRDELDEIGKEFYQWEVPQLPDRCIAAMNQGVRSDVIGIDLSNVSDLLQPGYLPLETGIASTPSGGLSVAVLTEWPGCSSEMIDWWFGWHIAKTDRYKLWHPQAHFFTQPKYDLSHLEELSDREKYRGNTSWVDEYIGPFPSRLGITFHDPAEIGLTEPQLESAGYGTVIYAVTTDSDHGVELSHLVHAVRRTENGCEMRSRFILPPGAPEFIGPPLLDHCWTEMTHLASFLPRLYRRVTGK